MRSLSPNSYSFTPDRVRQILRDDLYKDERYGKPTFECTRTAIEHSPGGPTKSFDLPTRKLRAATWVHNYCSQIADPETPLLRLDSEFSKLLHCYFTLKRGEDEDGAVYRACHILSRLPELPPSFEGLPQGILDSLDERHFIGQANLTGHQKWRNLQAVAFISTNVIRMALISVLDPGSGMDLHIYVGTISELLQVLCENSRHEEHSSVQFLVKAFLWSAWQRSIMLFLSCTLHIHMRKGYRMDFNHEHSLQSPPLSPQLDVEMPDYLCRWAYELLRTGPSAVGGDLRRFHQRYRSLYAQRPPRCCANNAGLYISCNGKAAENCGRFVGMVIEDQSTHHPSCAKTCPRLYWDEVSYQNVDGARAVSVIEEVSNCHLRYVAASIRTMAISHVWSHGQGGRPEKGTTGFNACLHDRYCSIARSFGCDSYWMDTPCIPGLHENMALRKEAIDKINEVFSGSKITLICDRDLMEIDVNNMTLELQESILATFLVCDWNVRAWTLLEAMRGTAKLYLLFKNDIILSFNQILKTVYSEGSIDIAILFTETPHLLPRRPIFRHSHLPIDRAASLLSHRYATREDDEVVIWSLLCDEKACHSAEEFWRSRMKGTGTISTGFLMSSVPRVKDCLGLTWAPVRPNLHKVSRHVQERSLPSSSGFGAFDGQGSERGNIFEDGLIATWLVHFIQLPGLRFDSRAYHYGLGGPLHGRYRREHGPTATSKITNRFLDRLASPLRKRDTVRQISEIADMYLRGQQVGALLRPKTMMQGDVAFEYRGKANGPLVAVIGSTDKGMSWCWKGIYEWNEREPLPMFVDENILLT